MVGRHLRDGHKDRQWSLSRELQEAIAVVCRQHCVPCEFPKVTPSREPRPQIAGLRLNQGYGCPNSDCAVAGTKAYVEQHIRKRHNGLGLKPERDIYYQCFNLGAAKKGIRVTPARVVPQVEDALASRDAAIALVQALFSDSQSRVQDRTRGPANSRTISAWLMRAGFYKLSENKDPGPLRALVAMPDDGDPLSWVTELVRGYMFAASELIAHTSLLSLQYLNSSSTDEYAFF